MIFPRLISKFKYPKNHNKHLCFCSFEHHIGTKFMRKSEKMLEAKSEIF